MYDGPTKKVVHKCGIAELRPRVVDFRFTDVPGRWGHASYWLAEGDDASTLPIVGISSASLMGWGDPVHSDLALQPICETAFLDPFAKERTAVVNCHLIDSSQGEVSDKDSRATLERCCRYLIESGIADECLVGTELEFYLFDKVHFRQCSHESSFSIVESDGLESAGLSSSTAGLGHRISYAAHRFTAGPADWANDFRTELSRRLSAVGVEPLHHQHEEGPSQNEISLRRTDAVTAADRIQLTKYVVIGSAHAHGRTATFMPKPMAYRPGSGLHINVSLRKSGSTLFAGQTGRLSALGMAFLAGVLAHARALTALLNPSANSFKRLDALSNPMVPVSYGVGNRTVPVRIPHVHQDDDARIEVRFGDAAANPYLAIAAILLAGVDGIERGLMPGPPCEGSFLQGNGQFDPRRRCSQSLCRTLEEAVVALDEDSDFLLKGGSFSSGLLNAHLSELCRQIRVCRALPHPNEFLMSYGI